MIKKHQKRVEIDQKWLKMMNFIQGLQ